MKTTKLTKFEATVLRLDAEGLHFITIAGQLNRTAAAVERAYNRAVRKHRAEGTLYADASAKSVINRFISQTPFELATP